MTQQQPRTAHPYHMYDAILSQPDSIERVLLLEEEPVTRLADALRGLERLHVVGIGTSWHAALVGEHLLRTVGNRAETRAWNSFEFRHDGPRLGPTDGVIVLSHRGTKRYSVEALSAAQSAGALTAVVTGAGSALNDGDAPHIIRTSAMERSAAFTVSHTTALTALAMLAARMGGESAGWLLPGLEQLHVLTEWTLATEIRLRALAKELKGTRWIAIAGAGANAGTAYEAALKLNEAAYALAQGFQIEQLLHGPFVAFDNRDALIVLGAPGRLQERTIEVLRAAAAVGVHTVVLADEAEDGLAKVCKTFIGLPRVPEPLTPITFLPPLQMLTYWLGLERGTNPDSFRLQDPAHHHAREFYSL